MNRFFLLLLCTVLVPLHTGADLADPDTQLARQKIMAYVAYMEQVNMELEQVVESGKFDQLRSAIDMLGPDELSLFAHRLPEITAGGPDPDTITFPDPEILPVCEWVSPTFGYVLYVFAAVLNETLASLKWACLQSVAGENDAALCAVTGALTATANMAFQEASICLNTQRTGYQTANFETQSNIADHLNQYIDATVSSRASQSSLDDLQASASQELQDLGTLANSVSADVSDLNADLTDISNSTATLISATINMTSVSQDLQLKTQVTQAEAEEIDDFAADTQERLESVRIHTQQINASVASLQQLLDQLSNTADARIERELDASVAQALADPNFNIVRYKLPAAMNGELERSREVLIRAILAFDGIGVDTSKATQYLTMGDVQFNAGRYLTAYDHFSTAYRMLLEQSSESPGRGE